MAKVRLLGEIVAIGCGAGTPCPLKVADCGLPEALSVKVSVPERGPVAVGVNVTFIVQLAEAAKVAPQVVVRAKSPDTTIEVMFRVAFPVF